VVYQFAFYKSVLSAFYEYADPADQKTSDEEKDGGDAETSDDQSGSGSSDVSDASDDNSNAQTAEN
ncbi:MAG: hypothetical protein K2M22_09570, partial [Lachnospiraceae bacterium]|nr:hypothetical protein [Lachnospiraceae bacterium]